MPEEVSDSTSVHSRPTGRPQDADEHLQSAPMFARVVFGSGRQCRAEDGQGSDCLRVFRNHVSPMLVSTRVDTFKIVARFRQIKVWPSRGAVASCYVCQSVGTWVYDRKGGVTVRSTECCSRLQ